MGSLTCLLKLRRNSVHLLHSSCQLLARDTPSVRLNASMKSYILHVVLCCNHLRAQTTASEKKQRKIYQVNFVCGFAFVLGIWPRTTHLFSLSFGRLEFIF